MTARAPNGIVNVASPPPRMVTLIDHPKKTPTSDAEAGAEQGDEHRLPAHGGAGLAAGHPDGTQQAELTGALVDRQRHAVGDAEQGDDDGEPEQPVHQVDDLVELRRLIVDVLGAALQVGVGVCVADAADGGHGGSVARRRPP